MLKILNANPGLGAPLNEQETRDFLTASKLNVPIIGIITPLDFTRSQGYAGSDDNDTIEKLLEYYI